MSRILTSDGKWVVCNGRVVIVTDGEDCDLCGGGDPGDCPFEFGPSPLNVCAPTGVFTPSETERFTISLRYRSESFYDDGGTGSNYVGFDQPWHVRHDITYDATVDLKTISCVADDGYDFVAGRFAYTQEVLRQAENPNLVYTSATYERTDQAFLTNTMPKFLTGMGLPLFNQNPAQSTVRRFFYGGDAIGLPTYPGPLYYLLSVARGLILPGGDLNNPPLPQGWLIWQINFPDQIRSRANPRLWARPFRTDTEVETPCNGFHSVVTNRTSGNEFVTSTLEWGGLLSQTMKGGSLTYRHREDFDFTDSQFPTFRNDTYWQSVDIDASFAFTGNAPPLPFTEGGAAPPPPGPCRGCGEGGDFVDEEIQRIRRGPP